MQSTFLKPQVLIKSLVFFLLFLLPFVVLPFGTSYYEIPKVIAAEIVIEIMIGIFLFTGKPKVGLTSPLFLVLYSGLFALSAIDLFFFRTSVSFFGNAFRLQGIFLLWHVLAFSLLSRSVTITAFSRHVIFFFLLFQTIFALLLGTNSIGRAYGLLGEPNSLAAVAVFAFPFLFFFRHTYEKAVFLAGMLLCVALVFLSGSRSGMLAIFIESLFIILTTHFRFPLKRAVIFCSLVFLGFLTLPFLDSGPHENRAEVWRVGLVAGMHSPIFGWGFGNVETAFSETTKTLSFPTFIGARYVDSSHNIFLDFFIQGGVLGLSIFITLLVLVFLQLIKHDKKAEATLLLGFVTVLSFNPSSVWVLIVFWYLIGQGVVKES